jgi:hypothetical protein
MFWFKSFRKIFRKIAIFRNFDHWSEILSMLAGRPLGQGVCPSLFKTSKTPTEILFAYHFLSTFTSIFKEKKLLMEGSESIPLTNVSGWLKHLRILRIRIARSAIA